MTTGDRGSGSVLVLALVAAVLLLASGAAGVAQVAVAASRAAAAADASALAAASSATAGEAPCPRAGSVAESAGAHLSGCAASAGGVVDVEVTVTPRGALALVVGVVSARARAGPAP